MSSLLDVLHKRPPRSRLAVSETQSVAVPAQPAPEESLTAELQLEAETRRVATPEGQPEESAGTGYEDSATAMRRWADRAENSAQNSADNGAARGPSQFAEPAATSHAQLAQASTPLRRPEASQKMLLVALLVAAGLFAAFLIYQFSVPAEENFVVNPAGPASDFPSTASVEELPLPGTPAAEVPVQSPAVPGKPVTRPAPATPKLSPVEPDAELAWYDEPALPAATELASTAQPVIQISRGETEDPLFEKLRTAYAALKTGAGARAETLYREVLAGNPGSIDALLGLASLATQGGRYGEARELYRQVQRLDPKNGTAAAALSALPGGASQSGGQANGQNIGESQLKLMLREQPDSAQLHFALGLRYIADQRWPDAQQAFFEALRHDPTNADYAFNLAVSLDRLGQSQPALSYYQRALDLASGTQQFDPATARSRLETLRGPRS